MNRVAAMSGVALLLVTVEAGASSEFVRTHGPFLAKASKPKTPFELKGSFQPDVGIDDADVESNLARARFDLRHLYGVNEDVAIHLGAGFGIRHYDFDSDVAADEQLWEIGLRLGTSFFVSDDLMFSLNFTPGVFSDLDDSLSGGDFRYQGSALGQYAVGEAWVLKLGLAVSEDFEELQVIPLGGFSWRGSERLRVDVLLPRELTVTWLPIEDLPLAFEPGVVLEGQQYHIDTRGADADIQIQDVRVQWLTRYTMKSGVSSWLTLGANVRGKYELQRSGSNEDFDQEPSFFVGLGIGGPL